MVWYKTSSPQTEKVCKRNVPEKAGKIDIQQREEDNKSRKAGFICLKILAAVDGSDMSSKALDAAIHLAKEQQAELTILYAGREAVVSTSALTGIVYVPENFIEDIKHEVEQKERPFWRRPSRKRLKAG